MVDVSAIAGTLSALKGAKDIASALIGLRDAQLIQEKVIELNGKILDAQGSMLSAQEERSTLVKRIGDLEKEIADLKAWTAEKERYELREISPGAFAYQPKPAVRGSEPNHWLCATCFSRSKKSFLQFQTEAARKHVYKCPDCSGIVTVNWNHGPEKPYAGAAVNS